MAVTQRAAQYCEKFLIVWMLYPVALPVISLPRGKGLTCLLNLLLVFLYFSFYISLSALSETIHPKSSIEHYLTSLYFTLTHLSYILSFFLIPDVNECLSARACQFNERCVNTAGSYVCQRLITCPPGHQINNDICEGTPHLISITAFTSTPQYVVNTSRRAFVLLHAHNVGKAHCSGKHNYFSNP